MVIPHHLGIELSIQVVDHISRVKSRAVFEMHKLQHVISGETREIGQLFVVIPLEDRP